MWFGLITGVGRSGSMWVAHTLAVCTDADARHESICNVEQFNPVPGRIEVNTYWWTHARYFRQTFPDAVLVHQVRDGRLVVRSAMCRHPEWTFEDTCDLWSTRALSVAAVADATLRLEDLVDPKHAARERLCRMFDLEYRKAEWESRLGVSENGMTHYPFPHPEEWSSEMKATYWERCGEAMRMFGYV